MENTIQPDGTIAMTIRDQLGHRCLYMIGAKDLIAGPNYLQLRFRGSTKANLLRITLDPSDTYTMEFFKVRSLECKLIKKYTDVYVDQLHELIRSTTGLNTNL